MVNIQSGMPWHKTIFRFLTMILQLYFLGQRNKTLPINHQRYFAFWTSCLQRGKEYHTSPHTNVFSLTKRDTHQLAFAVGTFTGARESGYQFPVTFTKSKRNNAAECLWKSSSVLVEALSGQTRSLWCFQMVLCKWMWGKGKLQTNVKWTVDFRLILIKYCASVED